MVIRSYRSHTSFIFNNGKEFWDLYFEFEMAVLCLVGITVWNYLSLLCHVKKNVNQLVFGVH